MTKEEKFYNALKDIFVGAKVEGESGYINLMRIKSRYYEKGVFPKLQNDIEEALKPFPEFKEELFDKLYTFFHRYFSESGSIYFRYTPIHQNVYEKIYTDDKDVMLFWKTHMLYYVKTDRLFKNLEVETDGFKFFFDVSTLEHKKAFEKREIIYEFKEIRNDGAIVFNVFYSERNRTTKTEEILKALNKGGIKITEDVLEKAFRVFEKQSEVDYFINKNAKEFLREQFNIWLYQYVFSGESEWTEKRIKQLQVLKDIAFKIIDFISQFEDELVKIWNKPKFVLNSNYVITLDRIVKANRENGFEIIEKIINHPNFDEQINEWKELGIIEEIDKSRIIENTLNGKELNKKYQFLPIDTKYFKDLELEILGLFDDLDNSLDGWLIKSENYQALNTILPKFKEKIQTIYIDPPFNKEQDADYFYSVKYKDSSWITLLENRLQLARDILKDTGSIFVRCDYNGNMYVRLLMNEIFGEENFRNEISVSRISKQDPKVKRFNTAIDSLYFYSRSEKFLFNLLFKNLVKAKSERWHAMDSQGQGQPLYIFGYLFEPPKGRHWTYGQEKIKQMEEEGKIRLKCKKCGYIHTSGIWKGCPQCQNKNEVKVEYLLTPTEVKQIDSNWTDIPGSSPGWDFNPVPNSEILLKRVIESTSNESDLVMDFFLGSGTTTAVAHKLKRKWIGVEMGEHFYSVVLPRMKKVLFYDKSGISKEKDVKEKYNEKTAGGFFKYYELEQYEDTLRRVKYEDSDLFDNPYQDPYNQYVFMRDLKMLEALGIDYENNKVNVDLSKLYQNIDIPETLSNLLGKWIKRITPDYVEFEDGEKINIKNLDYKLIKPLIWW
jgi:adenine-specific DNA-methyltransferase